MSLFVNVYNVTIVKLSVVHIVLVKLFLPFVKLLFLNLAYDFLKLPLDG